MWRKSNVVSRSLTTTVNSLHDDVFLRFRCIGLKRMSCVACRPSGNSVHDNYVHAISGKACSIRADTEYGSTYLIIETFRCVLYRPTSNACSVNDNPWRFTTSQGIIQTFVSGGEYETLKWGPGGDRVKIIALSDKGVLGVYYSHFKPLKIFWQIGQKWRVDIQMDIGHSKRTWAFGFWRAVKTTDVRVKIITLSGKEVTGVSCSHFKPLKIFWQIGQKWRVDIQMDIGRS